MTDHADTIRRALHHPEWDIEGEAALDALLAERQQAQEERDAALNEIRLRDDRDHLAYQSFREVKAQRQQAQDKLWEQSEAAADPVKEVERLEAERQQAQEEAEAWKESSRTWEARYNGEAMRLDKAEAERRQAIDALREARAQIGRRPYAPVAHLVMSFAAVCQRVEKTLDAALVKLGEKP